jgi:phenylpropionate dioxygenase-like ring-hydroxylating dioxygenase large terminal subunit
MKHLPDDRQRYWLYYRLWPNLAFDIYPEQMDFMQFIPIDANTTMIREMPYALPDGRRETKAAQYLNWRINRQVNKEDTDLINLVQEGMNTSRFLSGPLADSEKCLIDSANKIRKYIPVSSIDERPDEDIIKNLNSELLATS